MRVMVSRGRELEPHERAQIIRIMREQDRVMREQDKIQDRLDALLERRDALLRALRWGGEGRAEVMPETLRIATRSQRFPGGLSRTTLHRAVGRRRDREINQDSGVDDEQEQRS